MANKTEEIIKVGSELGGARIILVSHSFRKKPRGEKITYIITIDPKSSYNLLYTLGDGHKIPRLSSHRSFPRAVRAMHDDMKKEVIKKYKPHNLKKPWESL